MKNSHNQHSINSKMVETEQRMNSLHLQSFCQSSTGIEASCSSSSSSSFHKVSVLDELFSEYESCKSMEPSTTTKTTARLSKNKRPITASNSFIHMDQHRDSWNLCDWEELERISIEDEDQDDEVDRDAYITLIDGDEPISSSTATTNASTRCNETKAMMVRRRSLHEVLLQEDMSIISGCRPPKCVRRGSMQEKMFNDDRPIGSSHLSQRN